MHAFVAHSNTETATMDLLEGLWLCMVVCICITCSVYKLHACNEIINPPKKAHFNILDVETFNPTCDVYVIPTCDVYVITTLNYSSLQNILLCCIHQLCILAPPSLTTPIHHTSSRLSHFFQCSTFINH